MKQYDFNVGVEFDEECLLGLKTLKLFFENNIFLHSKIDTAE